MILFIVPLATWLYNQASDIASSVGDFLRSIPSYFAPKPIGSSSAYTPPFSGGQCLGDYIIEFNYIVFDPNGGNSKFASRKYDADLPVGYARLNPMLLAGKIVSVQKNPSSNAIEATNSAGRVAREASGTAPTGSGYTVDFTLIGVKLDSGGADNCGDLANPAPPPNIPNGDLFKTNNPTISNENNVINPAAIVLAPALPLVLVPLISSAIAAALAAARAAADALEAIKKIAEALEGLSKLWDKLKEFLDEWEKNRPKKRDIVRQTYGQIVGDGALDFFSSNNKKAQAIQLDIIITSIPIGIGKYFGSLSPSRYRYKELGYIAFYSVNQGILEIHSLQFKRSTLQIPELAVGFIYHLGLDEAIRGYAFGTFSIEKE